MPWKFIFTIIVLVVVVIFAGFNVHTVKINFGFVEIKEIPMFVCILSAFFLGTIVSVPFVMISKKRKQKKVTEKKKLVTATIPPVADEEGNQIVTKGKNTKSS